MECLLLVVVLTLAGASRAYEFQKTNLGDCIRVPATNWTWPDGLISRWLIYPTSFKSVFDDPCRSSTVFQNLSIDTSYTIIQSKYEYVTHIWIDRSILHKADMSYFKAKTLRISNSILVELSLPSSLSAVYFQNVSMKGFPSYYSDNLRTWSGNNISIKSLDLDSFNKGSLKSLEITNGYLSWFRVGSPFHSLENLDLHENKLQTLPNDLDNLLAVEKLNFSKNRLEFLEMDLFDGLESLKVLDLSFNRLTVSTYSPLVLPALERLSLNDCDLKSLNVLYWQMPNLEVLNVENNYMLSNINHLRNHFSEDTIIQISNVENWCCDWLADVAMHFKLEQRPSENENGRCRACLVNPFNDPTPSRSGGQLSRSIKEVNRRLQAIIDKL
ncbi:leucine-rich repeat and death domain-containing protein 1-like [Culex pipiens pallens]|uniref:leucine-rich repeat and death domain-containing protein 1-like n=1 Tax=Culex pipiens pallens TaxID=42434 RepID=UPI0019541A90|nr:leucine-rich repeat and death domain-containing protein 1-like [Culex pipiens pallens]